MKEQLTILCTFEEAWKVISILSNNSNYYRNYILVSASLDTILGALSNLILIMLQNRNYFSQFTRKFC